MSKPMSGTISAAPMLTVLFGPDAITSQNESTSLELGGGITHDFTKNVSAFAMADYMFDLDGGSKKIFEGRFAREMVVRSLLRGK